MSKNNINNIKLTCLKKTYIKYIKIFKNFHNHIKNLEENFIFNSSEILYLKNNIFDLVKKLNTYYNKELLIYVNNKTNIELLEINNLKLLNHYNKYFPRNDIFLELKNKFFKLINIYGYTNLLEVLNFYYEVDLENILDDNTYNFLTEINELIIPTSINFFTKVNKNKKKNYYWKTINNNKLTDFLIKEKEFHLILPNNLNLVVTVIFKNDYFLLDTKTCKINKNIHYLKKTKILKLISNTICNKFLKIFINNDYLGNIYSLNEKEYVEYIKKQHETYIKLSNTSFINLIKEISNKNIDINKIFTTIKLLLFGNNENIDMGGLLLGLLKEKKICNKINLYNFIFNNLSYNLQIRIKKSSSHIKQKMNKIKSLTIKEIDYKKQLAISKNIPDYVKALILEKINEMKNVNNEYYKQQTFVKLLLNYPWENKNEIIQNNILNNDSTKYLKNLQNNFDNLCYGHNESKSSILQIIGKWISNPNSNGISFGFVGPPGVGKTLLAKSLSDSLNIPFTQITLGGQNDGELLHGHGYTYSGSQPGLIVKKMVEMGKQRCIIYFDELDKTCTKHGSINEITSILIHLTDPNMNKSFQDRFFQGINFPLNKVIFIFSYNDSSLIDPILLDRIKEINVNPYNMYDKINICEKFILPEIKKEIKINKNVIMKKNILEFIINNYTNEAGVRNLKRLIEEIFLKINIDKLLQENKYITDKDKEIIINNKVLKKLLKEPCIELKKINDTPLIGVINGLFATTSGLGGITLIQILPKINATPDKHYLKFTGNQGKVMKESIECSFTTAINFLKINKKKYDINNLDQFLSNNFKNGFHIHTPSTSTPKDGPSAGCAFTCAFISCILKKNIKNNIAMTGEIDLIGNISKIGGLEYKLYGAKKAGVDTVFIPKENTVDLNLFKKKYKNFVNNKFSVVTVKNINELIDNIFL